MGLFDYFRKQKPQSRAVTWDQLAKIGGFVESPTLSGVTVNEKTALGLSTVFRATRVVSEAVGTMPIKVYRRTPDGREEAQDHPLYTLLHDEPNPEQSAVDFWTLIQFWAVLWGHAEAEIERDNAGNVLALWPIPPTTIRPTRINGTLAYEVETGEGRIVLEAENVFSVKGPSPDGSQAYRLIELARESFGFSLALDRFGSAYFGNSCKVGGVLKTAGQLSETARENLRKSWAMTYQGVENVGKIPVLEEGLDFLPHSISNESGQYIETREYQCTEICRWMGVDPIFVYNYGRATWNNAEAQTRNFLQFSLNPWLRKIESELRRKCFLQAEKQEFYAEFLRESIVQMDAKTQHEVWKIGKDGGWYTADEIRQWLNLPPLPEPTPAPPAPPPPSSEPQPETPPQDNAP